jgi:hypothetical protein
MPRPHSSATPNEVITDTYYIEKAKLAPDVSDVLQSLGAGGKATG